jgi:hypothetical protein
MKHYAKNCALPSVKKERNISNVPLNKSEKYKTSFNLEYKYFQCSLFTNLL